MDVTDMLAQLMAGGPLEAHRDSLPYLTRDFSIARFEAAPVAIAADGIDADIDSLVRDALANRDPETSRVEMRGINTAERWVDLIASTSSLDSHNTVLDQESWKLNRFFGNPVMLFEHGMPMGMFVGSSEMPEDKIPIARAERVRIEGGALRMRAYFATKGQSRLADHVFDAIVDRRLNAFSVGFRPGKVERVDPPEGSTDLPYYRLSDNELCEVSIVAVPSNADAVAQRTLRYLHSRGFISPAAEPSTSTKQAGALPEETPMTFLEILAKRFACEANEAAVLNAIETANRAADAASASAKSLGEENAKLKAPAAVGVACISALGSDAATEAGAVKAIVALQGRAKVADDIEPKYELNTKRVLELEAADGDREVSWLLARGKDYRLNVGSKDGLAAYRKVNPAGFALEYKAALDGLRVFDKPELFQSVTTPAAGAVTRADQPPPAVTSVGEPLDVNAEIRSVADEMQAAAVTKGKPMARAAALEAARLKVTG